MNFTPSRSIRILFVSAPERIKLSMPTRRMPSSRGSVQSLSPFRLAERRPALAHAVMAPLICWSFSSSMFRYLFVDHAVPAMWRSLAPRGEGGTMPKQPIEPKKRTADYLARVPLSPTSKNTMSNSSASRGSMPKSRASGGLMRSYRSSWLRTFAMRRSSVSAVVDWLAANFRSLG